MLHIRKTASLLALVTVLGACEHFLSPETPSEAVGPIAPGFARIRIENTGNLTVRETWYSTCLGSGDILKVRRRIGPGESTQQDVQAGCIRITIYPDAGAFHLTVQAPAGEVTLLEI